LGFKRLEPNAYVSSARGLFCNSLENGQLWKRQMWLKYVLYFGVRHVERLLWMIFFWIESFLKLLH
jgi:hypothetical protein